MVGLGNPGRAYRGTRHNAGVEAARLLEAGSELLAKGRWPDGRLFLVKRGQGRFLVLEPRTFMNVSGRAVAPVAGRYRIGPGRVIVLHDDIDIPLGEVRVKRGGGTAGHRGLESLAEALGGRGFTRVRIGVGRPPDGVDPTEHVLSAFREDEREAAGESIARASELALELALQSRARPGGEG